MRIKVNNKSEIVYLVQIIDDASRLIVGQALTFHDNAVFFQKVLKKAVNIWNTKSLVCGQWFSLCKRTTVTHLC